MRREGGICWRGLLPSDSKRIFLSSKSSKLQSRYSQFFEHQELSAKDVKFDKDDDGDDIEIGSGSMGTVWRGTHQDAIPVAIKKLRSGLPDISGLEKELKMFGLLKHPKIIRLYGYYSKNSRLHLVLELGSQDLRSYLESQTGDGLPFSKAVAFSQDLAEGLAFLHGKDIIHLDIKSSNAILCNGDVMKITDFGTAWKMIGTATQSTMGKSGRGRLGLFVACLVA